MKQILEILGKSNDKPEQKMEEEATREELLAQRARLEEKIKRFEKREVDDRIKDSLRKLQEVTESLSDIQNALNLAWKRTKQIEEELSSALNLS